MRELKILPVLQAYEKSDAVRLHMPGHKGRENIIPLCGLDITELSFSGCLFAESGITREAEENIAQILSARRSFMLTDGSSCGILAMCYALSKRGKKVIIPRISHKSVYNGLKIFGLEPLFLTLKDDDGVILQSLENIEELLKEDGVAGVLIISPDYYGRVPDLKGLRLLCDKYGKILAVDGAHGCHLRFACTELYAGNYADVWVDGVHKTLSCLTQAALLNVNKTELLEDIEEGLGIFRTTSPSYPVMASIEYGVYALEEFGSQGFKELFVKLDRLEKRLLAVGYYFDRTDDRCKPVLNCRLSGVCATKLTAFLEEENIYCEFADEERIIFMVSAASCESDFDRLADALEKYRSITPNTVDNVRKRGLIYISAKKTTPYSEAVNAEWELTDYPVGRISATNVGLFPPCYPLVIAGELITEEIYTLLKCRSNVFGLTGSKFKVLK